MARYIQEMAATSLASARDLAKDVSSILPPNTQAEMLVSFKTLLNAIREKVEQTEAGAYRLYANQIVIRYGPDLIAIIVISLFGSPLNCNEDGASC